MRKVCKLLFPLWLFGAFPVAFLTLGSWNYDHSFGHPPVGLWTFSACYALAGVVMFVVATRSATKDDAHSANDVNAPPPGANWMRKFCKFLFPLWLFGAFPVAFLALGSWNYDHRFGHPPVGLWIFSACYALAGAVIFVVATKRTTTDSAHAA